MQQRRDSFSTQAINHHGMKLSSQPTIHKQSVSNTRPSTLGPASCILHPSFSSNQTAHRTFHIHTPNQTSPPFTKKKKKKQKQKKQKQTTTPKYSPNKTTTTKNLTLLNDLSAWRSRLTRCQGTRYALLHFYLSKEYFRRHDTELGNVRGRFGAWVWSVGRSVGRIYLFVGVCIGAACLVVQVGNLSLALVEPFC